MLPRRPPLGERGLGLATSVLALGLRVFRVVYLGALHRAGRAPSIGPKNPLRSVTLHTPPLRQPELGIPVVSKGGLCISVRFLLLHEERSVSGDFGGSPPKVSAPLLLTNDGIIGGRRFIIPLTPGANSDLASVEVCISVDFSNSVFFFLLRDEVDYLFMASCPLGGQTWPPVL